MGVTGPPPAGAEPLRVLFFTASLGGGGAEKHLVRVLNAMDRSRCTPHVALCARGGSYEADLARDVPVHHLGGFLPLPSSALRMMAAVRPLRALVRRLRPHVVCSVMDHANLAAAAAVRPLADPPRLVFSVQNPPLVHYGSSRHPLKRWKLARIPRVYPRADRIVAISRDVEASLAELAPGLAPSIEVIYNAGLEAGIHTAAGEPLPPALARPAGPLLVACGRLTEQKGFPILLRAFARVRERHPGAALWIVGEGPQRPLLERLTRELGLDGAVRLLGFQRNPYRFMAAADLFVLSSLWEGFGNVVVEAMACGAPVVATRCEGPAEIIRSDAEGLLVPTGDAQALADAIDRLLGDPALRRSMRERGAARSRDFDDLASARRHLELFESLAAR